MFRGRLERSGTAGPAALCRHRPASWDGDRNLLERLQAIATR